MGEKTITGYATGELTSRLSGLTLGDGVSTSETGGWVSGDVSIGERKGKSFPIYSLEIEVPFEGTLNGKAVKGAARMPDVSLEMLDDLEVEFTGVDDDAKAALNGEALRAAVREWAAGVRKAVSENLASLPLDPPSQAVKPRAAALISDEEAMSAGGSARLEDDDIEEVPHPDDVAAATGEEGEEGEDEPFTEQEVTELYAQVQEMLKEAVETEAEYDEQMTDLDKELDGKDVDQKGRILYEVLDYLEQGEEEAMGEEGEEGEGGAQGGGARGGDGGDAGDGGDGGDDEADYEPYPGPEGLDGLWKEVLDLCAEEDVPRLEEELKGKRPEDQWKTLLEVRSFLLEGDEEEKLAFEEWQPTASELDAEWQGLMAQVPPEEAKQVEGDYAKASAADKKRMVWDVKKFLDEEEEEGEEEEEEEEEDGAGGAGASGQPRKAPPPRPPTDAELGGPSEMRRRGGGGATRGREYEREFELGLEGGGPRGGSEWDEFYKKEGKARRGRGGSLMLYGLMAVCLMLLALGMTAAAVADEEESIPAAALRLVGLGAPVPAPAPDPVMVPDEPLEAAAAAATQPHD